jgi:hypothetical protein
MLSLGQAARLAQTSKTTLTRAIKAGRLSATRRDDGSYAIDRAELGRVYTLKTETPDTPATVTATGDVVHQATPAETPRDPFEVRLASVEGELTGARQLIRFLEEQAEDLRRDRDGWRQQAETTQRLLTHARETAIVPAAAPSRPWWKRLAG